MHVTVIMSVYNEVSTVGNAIASIVNQSYEDWEMIIVDDNSMDGTYEILLGLVEKYPKITLIRNEKTLGLARSLNKALNFASGELIARMDGDDFSYPKRLERQVEFMRRNPDVEVLGTGADLVDHNDKILSTVYLPETHEELVRSMPRRLPFFHPSVMFRKEFFKKFKGYEESMRTAQDYELWLRSYKFSRFHNIQESLIRYRTNYYKRSLKNIMGKFHAHIFLFFKHGYYLHGIVYALLRAVKSFLIKFGFYKPKSIRKSLLFR